MIMWSTKYKTGDMIYPYDPKKEWAAWGVRSPSSPLREWREEKVTDGRRTLLARPRDPSCRLIGVDRAMAIAEPIVRGSVSPEVMPLHASEKKRVEIRTCPNGFQDEGMDASCAASQQVDEKRRTIAQPPKTRAMFCCSTCPFSATLRSGASDDGRG